MNIAKICIGIFVVACLFTLLTGSSHTNIDGVNFNIPSGFEAGETQEYVKQGHHITEVDYKNKDGIGSFSIKIVDNYQPKNKKSEKTGVRGNTVASTSTETIHGHTGIKTFLANTNGVFAEQFTYDVDDKHVIVTTSNVGVDDIIV